MNDISKYRNGRPPGARNRFSGQFLADLAEAGAEHVKAEAPLTQRGDFGSGGRFQVLAPITGPRWLS
jgi:hypothetical protein